MSKVRDALKMLGILMVGLFMAVIGYPILHESGHALAIVLCGATLQEVALFPLPYVACNMSEMGTLQYCLIGLSGMVLPFLVSLINPKRSFWAWYATLLLKGISLLAFLLSSVAMVCYYIGHQWESEDIIQVMKVWELFDGFWLLLVLLFAAVGMFSICRQHPVNKIMQYFNE